MPDSLIASNGRVVAGKNDERQLGDTELLKGMVSEAGYKRLPNAAAAVYRAYDDVAEPVVVGLTAHGIEFTVGDGRLAGVVNEDERIPIGFTPGQHLLCGQWA